MLSPTNTQPYPILARSFHWLTLLLLIVVFGLIELRELFPKGSEAREAMKYGHFLLGLSVLLLTALRLALRSRYTVPAIQPTPPHWQTQLAHAVHGLLYGWLLLMPLLGWLVLYASGKPLALSLLAGLELPALTPADKDLGRNIKEVHEALGSFGYFLIGGHALAALLHHYLLQDDTLRRMLPQRR